MILISFKLGIIHDYRLKYQFISPCFVDYRAVTSVGDDVLEEIEHRAVNKLVHVQGKLPQTIYEEMPDVYAEE